MRTSLYISNSKCVCIQGYTLPYLLSHCMIWSKKNSKSSFIPLKILFYKMKIPISSHVNSFNYTNESMRIQEFLHRSWNFSKVCYVDYGCSCVYLTAKTRLWLSKFPTLLPVFIYCWKNVNINAAVKFQENINTNQVFQYKCRFIFIDVSLFIQKFGT